MRAIPGLVLILIVFAVACDDPPPPPPPPTDGGGMDSGPDGGDVDASRDAALADGDTVDGFVGDAGPLVCTASETDVHKLAAEFTGADRIVGLAGGGDAFGVVWHETRGGQPDIFAVRLSPTDGLGTEQQLTNQFSRENTPTIVASGSSWIASWVDNEGSLGFDVRSQLLNADLSLSGTANAITVTDTFTEDNPTLANLATGPMLIWVEDDMVGGTRTARAQRLNADGTARGSVEAASGTGTRPGQLAIGELTDGPVLLWSEGVGMVQDLFLQPLSASGASSGSSSNISAESNVDGTVDAALTVSGGAVVFGVNVGGVRSEVRFSAIDSTGALVGSERTLVTPPSTARDPSIAAFAGGYAISYRVDDGDGTGAKIRLLLVDTLGDRIAEVDVAPAADGGGRTTIRATGTGHLAIAWADRRPGGMDVIVSLIRCGGS